MTLVRRHFLIRFQDMGIAPHYSPCPCLLTDAISDYGRIMSFDTSPVVVLLLWILLQWAFLSLPSHPIMPAYFLSDSSSCRSR